MMQYLVFRLVVVNKKWRRLIEELLPSVKCFTITFNAATRNKKKHKSKFVKMSGHPVSISGRIKEYGMYM